MGRTPNLTNLVGVNPMNTHTKFDANLCSGSRDEVKKGYYIETNSNTL